MGEIANKIIIDKFLKDNSGYIIKEGIINNKLYYFTIANYLTTNHLIDKDYIPSKSISPLYNSLNDICYNYIPLEIKDSSNDICYDYIPLEIKDSFRMFIAEELLKALFVTRELTTLFNTHLMYACNGKEQFLSNTDIKNYLSNLFEITDTIKHSSLYTTHYYRFKEEKIK